MLRGFASHKDITFRTVGVKANKQLLKVTGLDHFLQPSTRMKCDKDSAERFCGHVVGCVQQHLMPLMSNNEGNRTYNSLKKSVSLHFLLFGGYFTKVALEKVSNFPRE